MNQMRLETCGKGWDLDHGKKNWIAFAATHIGRLLHQSPHCVKICFVLAFSWVDQYLGVVIQVENLVSLANSPQA